jgi:hypothetical protein
VQFKGIAIGLAATIALAGCGGGSSAPKDNGESKKTGPVVANDAADALQQTGAVHVKGTEKSDGKPGTVDLQLQGQDVSGSVTVDSQAVSVIALGATTYFKAPASFWSAQKIPAQATALLADKWVKIPASQSGGLTNDLSLSTIVNEIRKPTNGTITPAVKTGTFAGQPTVVVSQTDGSTLDVAATGQPLPLHLVDTGTNGDDVTLTEFGVRQAITAPPGALDLTKLAGG